jgi:N-acetyltransferase
MHIEPFELRGRFVRLTPMALADVDGLLAAATEDRATYGYTTVPGDRDAMTAHV